MLSISQLARRHHVSRATVLYYERAGLLTPATRGANDYRWYGPQEDERLRDILAYRALGLPVEAIRRLVEQPGTVPQQRLLREHLLKLDAEVARLRQQQQLILRYLEGEADQEVTQMNKDRWIEIMRAAGLDDEAMRNWHRNFERMEPQAHEEFLFSLGIEAAEVAAIRERSRG